MEQAIRNGEPVAATIVEPIQAEGGIVTDGHFVSSKIGHPPPPPLPTHTHFSGDKHASPQFFRGIQQICKKVCCGYYCDRLSGRLCGNMRRARYLIARNVRRLYFVFIFPHSLPLSLLATPLYGCYCLLDLIMVSGYHIRTSWQRTALPEGMTLILCCDYKER